MRFVATIPGHSSTTATSGAEVASSPASALVYATAAALLAAYAPLVGEATRPAIEAVTTTLLGPPCSISPGTNAATLLHRP